MTVHRHHHLFRSKTQLACGCVQNPCIGLMRHDPVDVLGGKVRKVQRFDHYACELADGEIGRASCRESVCQYVVISVVAVSLKKTKQQPNVTKPYEQLTNQYLNHQISDATLNKEI